MLIVNKRMYVFLLFLIGLGSFKCLFCGNVFDFYIIGGRVWFDYILLGRIVVFVDLYLL